MELVSKMSFCSISLARSGIIILLRLPAWSSAALLLLTGNASGSLELARWLSKPPEPFAIQTHEPKKKVVPRSGTVQLKPKLARQLLVFSPKPA